MARPLRAQWRIRTVVRRRHRTWIAAMILATLGWGAWWCTMLLHKLAPGLAPGMGVTYFVSCTLGVFGFVLGVFTIRARAIWVILAAVPMFSNGTLLLLPFVLGDPTANEGVETVSGEVDPFGPND